MPNITSVIGYRTAEDLRQAAANYHEDGYTTVQLGPTPFVQTEHAGVGQDWPLEAGKNWYVLIATKDPITAPKKKSGWPKGRTPSVSNRSAAKRNSVPRQ